MSKLFKACLLVIGLCLLAPWLDGGNHRVGAASPPPPVTPTVTAIKMPLIIGQTGQAGWGARYRILFETAESSANQTMLGYHGGVNYFLYDSDPGKHLRFMFSDAIAEQMTALWQQNPTLTQADFHEEACWGGFETSTNCQGETIDVRPKIDCEADWISADGAHVFEYQVTVNKAVVNPPNLPDQVSGIKVIFQ